MRVRSDIELIVKINYVDADADLEPSLVKQLKQNKG